MEPGIPGLRIEAVVGLVAVLTGFGIAVTPAYCGAGESDAAALPEIVRTQEGLVGYRTNNAVLPVFVIRLGEITGLDVRGVDLLEPTQLSSEQGVESVPALVARLLEGYNYILAFTANEGVSTGAAGTLVIAGRRGLSEQQDAPQAAESPDPGTLEAGGGGAHGAVGPVAGPAAPAGQEFTASNPRTSEPAMMQGKAPPTPPTVGSMMEDHLAPFRTSSGRGSGMGQLIAPAGVPQAASNAGSAPATAQAGGAGNTLDLQEATKRALTSVQEMARALEAASSQLSQQKK